MSFLISKVQQGSLQRSLINLALVAMLLFPLACNREDYPAVGELVESDSGQVALEPGSGSLTPGEAFNSDSENSDSEDENNVDAEPFEVSDAVGGEIIDHGPMGRTLGPEDYQVKGKVPGSIPVITEPAPLQLIPVNFSKEMPLVLIGGDSPGVDISVKVGGSWGDKPQVRVTGASADYTIQLLGCTPDSIGSSKEPFGNLPIIAIGFMANESSVGPINDADEANLDLAFRYFAEPDGPSHLGTTCTIEASSIGQSVTLELEIQYQAASIIPTDVKGTTVEDD